MNIEQCFCVMHLGICLLTEIKRYKSAIRIRISFHIKDAFNKFEQDFLASNLPEGKYIKDPPSTAKWYKVEQPCFEDKMQELNTDLSLSSPLEPLWVKFPYQFFRNWNIRLARISLPSISQLLLLNLLLVTPLWRSVNTV